MKTRMAIWVLMPLLVLGCRQEAAKAPDASKVRPVIAAVLQARVDAMARCSSQKRKGIEIDDKAFAAAVAGIDTHGCPDSFRATWLAYSQACDDRVKQKGKIFFELISGQERKMLTDAQDDPTHSTWQAVQREAMKSGVDCPPEPH